MKWAYAVTLMAHRQRLQMAVAILPIFLYTIFSEKLVYLPAVCFFYAQTRTEEYAAKAACGPRGE